MDLEFTPEELKFRDEVRAWIAEAYTDDLKKRMALSKNGSLDEKNQKLWQKKLADKGWLCTNWPNEHGGTGWNQTQKYIYEMEMALAGAPRMSSMGVRMCAPVIMKFGNGRAEEEIPAADPQLRSLVVPGLFRAGLGLRPRQPVDDAPSARATTTSSTAPRPGRPTRNGPTGSSASCAPRRKRRSRTASASSSST